MSQTQAEREYDLAVGEMDKVKDISLVIDFSELVTDPEKTLKSVCAWLDLDYEPRMLKGPEYNFVYPHKAVIASKAS